MDCPDENVIVAFAAGELDTSRVREIGAHLDVCSDCAAMVADAALAVGEPSHDEPTVRVAAREGDPPLNREGSLPRGSQLGRYVLLDLLATGGLGQVYTAFDPELDRRVAIKLLRPSHSGSEHIAGGQRWLMREAQAMAQLSHAHVVPIHDVGTFGDEVFLAMTLIDGRTLRVWLRERTRTWQEIREIFRQAGEGLIAAHEAGLVHRDFKPTNVLIDAKEQVYVVDFGLARAVAGPAASLAADPLALSYDPLLSEDLTETGAIIGTPAYMPPEQLSGREVDARADQFAFCLTLYESLNRERPFKGRSLEELYRAIVAGVTGEPADALPHPQWLRRAVLRGLSADANDRHASMRALLVALAQDRRSRRRQWAAIGGAALLSAVVVGAGAIALRPEVSATERDRVDVLAEAARAAAARAYFIYPPHDEPEFPTAYVRVLELEAMDGVPADVAHARAAQLRGEFADTLVRLGDSYWERDGGMPFASDYYAAAVVFDPERADARDRMMITPGQLAALTARAKDLSFSFSELAAAEALAALADPDEEARTTKVAQFSARDSGSIATRTQLERLFGADASPSITSDQPAVIAAAPIDEDATAGDAGLDPPPDGPSRPSARPGPRAPKPSTAEEDPVAERTAAARDPEAANAEVALGQQALSQGQASAAAKHFHRALEHDSRSAGALAGLAEVYFEQGKYSQAAKYGERAIVIAPQRAQYRLIVGDAYLKVMRYADARSEYTKAKELGHARAQSRLDLLEKKTGG